MAQQTSTVTLNYVIGGTSFSSKETKTAEGAISHVLDLPAGIAAVRTTPGSDTMVTGHGLVATDIVDVHWDDPTDGTHKVRRGLTIDIANANDVTFDETPAGEGDALPANGTALVLGKQVVVSTLFDGDDLELVATKCDVKSMVDMRTVAASKQAQKLAAGASWFWLKGFGFTNPLAASDITEAKASNGSVTAGTVNFALMYQSVA